MMGSKNRLVLTIGVFDGVHLGHRALVRETVKLARSLRARPEVLTFQDHPAHVLKGGPRVAFLLPREGTYGLLKRAGARKVHAIRFTRVFSKKSPEQFVAWLRTLGDLKGVVVGGNFRFGHKAQGDVRTLELLGKKYGFKVKALKPVKAGGLPVSSTLIRRFLAEGLTEKANRLLGRPYVLEGLVSHGKHLGHKIGFPTANLSRVLSFLPKDGVYACAVRIGGRFYRAGMNLGTRPTFREDDHHRQAEVHLMGYRGRLYGKAMKVHLLKYLRPERKFPSPKALVAQIKKDVKIIQGIPIRSFKFVKD